MPTITYRLPMFVHIFIECGFSSDFVVVVVVLFFIQINYIANHKTNIIFTLQTQWNKYHKNIIIINHIQMFHRSQDYLFHVRFIYLRFVFLFSFLFFFCLCLDCVTCPRVCVVYVRCSVCIGDFFYYYYLFISCYFRSLTYIIISLSKAVCRTY